MSTTDILPGRGLVRLEGPDTLALLQGQLTQNVVDMAVGEARFACMLTPQGKHLHEMFVVRESAAAVVLDTATPEALARRLNLVKLRAQVRVGDVSAHHAVVSAMDPAELTGTIFRDPRHPGLGWRAIAPSAEGIAPADGSKAEARRLALGMPDLSRDLVAERDFALEGLLEETHGVDFHKGCYVGQEMTSRMKRRTSVRTKLCRVRYSGHPPEFDSPILSDGWEVGRMRSGMEGLGIALVRFDRATKAMADGHPLMAGATVIRLDPPDWMIVPDV